MNLICNRFGASVNKVFSVQPINVNLRVFTLSRIPDYNDLFNVGAVVVAFDLTSVVCILPHRVAPCSFESCLIHVRSASA